MQYFFCNKIKTNNVKIKKKKELKTVQKRETFYKKTARGKRNKVIKKVVEAFIYVM